MTRTTLCFGIIPLFLCHAAIGLSGWGIAFYIDGKLAPLLRLKRGVTYTFIVEAGDDPNDAPNYHPFYITNSQDGGILLNQGMRVSKWLSNLCSRKIFMIVTTHTVLF